MKRLVLSTILVFSLLGVIHQNIAAPASASPTSPAAAITLPEGVDFATVVFGDAWDMSHFSDISQYLNGYGRHPSVINPTVQDGIFTATSTPDTSDPDAFFYPLFPGLPGFMQIGDLGSTHPIDSSFYRCFYIAMKVDTPATNDSFQVYWYPDNSLAAPSPSGSGATYPVSLYPEWSATKYWKLFKIELANPPAGTMGRGWSAYSPWQGLHVLASFYDSVPIAVDWIRLTPCHSGAEYRTSLTWAPDPAITAIWVRPQGTTRDIRVENGINGASGAYSLDTQGLAPGTYQVGLGSDTTCCTQWSPDLIRINAATIVAFERPSPTSGTDYATLTGNAWDMATSEDIDQIDCVSNMTLANGILAFDTLYPAALPPACRGPGVGEADPRIYLNMPGTLLIGHEYRYLSFHMYQSGNLPRPADGMVIRWLWTTTNRCTRVSADAPLDIGWHTYHIDLYDPFNGTPVEAANCAGVDYPLKPWWLVGQIMTLRFDPNENWTGKLEVVPPEIFHQEIDWMRLSKVDSVMQGETFPILVTLNKAASEVQYINFYYTTNRSDPTQHFIGQVTPSSSSLADAATTPGSPSPDWGTAVSNIYLPAVVNRHRSYPPLASNQVRQLWYTSAITPGEYYICAQPFDGYNLTTYCSEAPMQVLSP